MKGCNATSGVECKDESELNNVKFNFISLKSYIDFDEVNAKDVVKYLKSSGIVIKVNNQIKQETELFYKESEVSIQENPFALFSEPESYPIFEYSHQF